MATTIYAEIDAAVTRAFQDLLAERVNPWVHFNSKGIRTAFVDGSPILYEGIGFEPMPREAFWRHIGPYLERIADAMFDTLDTLSNERKIDLSVAAHELAGLLKTGAAVVFDRMRDIDRRLRGNGYPDSVAPRDTAAYLQAFDAYLARKMSSIFIDEKIAARSMLIATGHTASALWDQYSTWLLAGAAAFSAVLLTGGERLQPLLADGALKQLLWGLSVIVVLGLVQRLLTILVATMAAGEKHGKDLGTEFPNLSLSVFFQESLRALFWPGRWFFRRSVRQAMEGDFAASGRVASKLSQIQALLALLQTVVVLAMLIVLAAALTA